MLISGTRHPSAAYPIVGALGMVMLSIAGLLPAAADAGVIRGGGRGSLTGPVATGDIAYLLPTVPQTSGGPSFSAGDVTGNPDFSEYASYGINQDSSLGYAIQVHHSWDADCERGFISSPPSLVDCFFRLGPDEVFNWSGHVIGLPDERDSQQAPYPGSPTLSYRWLLTDADNQELTLFDDFGLSETLGDFLAPGAAGSAGCFALFADYNLGNCQTFDLSTSFTRKDFIDRLGSSAEIFLQLEVSISTPEDSGHEFFMLTDPLNGSPPFLAQDGFGLSAKEIKLQSVKMRINVPAPATVGLFATGLLMLWRRRSRSRESLPSRGS